MLIDTHCHIHNPEYDFNIPNIIKAADEQGVEKIICIGVSQDDSVGALNLSNNYQNVYCSVGVHPHEANTGFDKIEDLIKCGNKSLVAVGEIGLDYHYDFCPRDIQIKALESQIDIALKHNLPIIFHVREAFDDFWPIFDNFHGIRGVVHSFTDQPFNACEALNRGLYVGVNGFCTFTKDKKQQMMFGSLPIDQILLETDAPYLTPVPFRGTVNEPAYVRNVAEYLAALREVSLNELAEATTKNANALFNL